MTKLVGVAALLLIVLAGAANGQQRSAEPRRDVLFPRAGGLQEGALQGCSAASCSFSGRLHLRPTILLLGLAVGASEAPPAIADPSQDAVYLRNAVVVKSRLVSIDANQVVTEQGSQPRANVAWVFLAPAPASPGPRGDSPPPPGSRDASPLPFGQGPPSKTRTYHYDVTFRSMLKEEGTWHLKVTDRAGVVSCCEESEWTMETASSATFPNVPITVSMGDGSFAISSEFDTYAPEASARVTGKWRGRSQNISNIPTANCEGAKSWDTPARMVTNANVNQTNNTSSNLAIHAMEAQPTMIQGLLFTDCKGVHVGGAVFLMQTLACGLPSSVWVAKMDPS